MSSIREQIVVAAIASLNTARPADVPLVERARTFAIASTNLPSLAVFWTRDEVEDIGDSRGPIVRRTLTLHARCRAKGTASVNAETALDAMCCWVVKTLSDNKLGTYPNNLTNGITEQATECELAQADNTYSEATVSMLVDYTSRAADLELKT